MLRDIVIDTNVLVHAHNPGEQRQLDCIKFLLVIKDVNTKICLDEGFDLDESKNKSHIFSEYIDHLHFGMLGFDIIGYLARNQRITVVSRTAPGQISRKIRRCVKSNRDRVFVRVAFNSDDRTLTSHDFSDIPQVSRAKLAADINVRVISAD